MLFFQKSFQLPNWLKLVWGNASLEGLKTPSSCLATPLIGSSKEPSSRMSRLMVDAGRGYTTAFDFACLIVLTRDSSSPFFLVPPLRTIPTPPHKYNYTTSGVGAGNNRARPTRTGSCRSDGARQFDGGP